ncbi:hypothetical protein [Micromonospora sp. WMMD1274]|uniref:hypothetical protein n=1 Tax=Micromonospora sp. WMMD1274 TaxID=3404116 RepID=UPI003B92F862
MVAVIAAGAVVWLVPGGRAVMPPASPPAPPTGWSVEHPPVAGLPRSEVTPGDGAARVSEGVPVGYARTGQGAVQAATAWLALVEGAAGLDASRREALLSAIGDGQFVQAAQTRLAARSLVLGLDGRGLSARGPVMAVVWLDRGAYRVVRFSNGSAEVDIWYAYTLGVRVAGDPEVPLRWHRARAQLRWAAAEGDWRLVSDLTIRDGPDPGVPEPSAVDKADALAGAGGGWTLYATSLD